MKKASRRQSRTLQGVVAIVFGCGACGHMFGAECKRLAQLSLPHISIVSAEDRHSFDSSDGHQIILPDFCQVIASASPVPDSQIRIEVWIPISNWNGQLEGLGNGGYSSAINYPGMALALRRGSAVAATDTGHSGDDLKFADGHPEKIADWGYRSIHEMTAFAKMVVRAFEGRFPDHSYFNGCSTGGGQALSEAQRFPADYDGILAGDPGNDRVNLNAGFLWAYAADHRTPGQQLSTAKGELLHTAAIRACDGKDGVEDGVIDDPRTCHFDPASLTCNAKERESCLSPAEVETAQAIYAGPSYQGKSLYPGYEPGSESLPGLPINGWGTYLAGLDAPKRLDFWKYWAFGDPSWDWQTFDFNRDLEFANTKLAMVNAVDPDLHEFLARGGKLLLYHGWADPVVPPRSTIQYVDRVYALAVNQNASEGVRLFLVPGMGHCAGGYGPLPEDLRPATSSGQSSTASTDDPDRSLFQALVRWREQGKAPDKVLAEQDLPSGKLRTRPICVYPKIAKWNRRGSSDDAANFVCASPKVHP